MLALPSLSSTSHVGHPLVHVSAQHNSYLSRLPLFGGGGGGGTVLIAWTMGEGVGNVPQCTTTAWGKCLKHAMLCRCWRNIIRKTEGSTQILALVCWGKGLGTRELHCQKQN